MQLELAEPWEPAAGLVFESASFEVHAVKKGGGMHRASLALHGSAEGVVIVSDELIALGDSSSVKIEAAVTFVKPACEPLERAPSPPGLPPQPTSPPPSSPSPPPTPPSPGCGCDRTTTCDVGCSCGNNGKNNNPDGSNAVRRCRLTSAG